MSGGVGPSNDIVLKDESNHDHHHPPPRRRRSTIFNFQQLNALAIAVILSASGMVAVEDLSFVLFSFLYMYFLSRVAFPTLSHSNHHHHPVFHNTRLLRLSSILGTVVGLFLPVAYIFEGILEGDKEGIKASTPHVFLLASQLFLEGVAVSDQYSGPMRVLVMVVYNATRMFSLMEWVRVEVTKVGEEFDGSKRRLVVGRVLAVVNLVYWGVYLFGFLLPVYVPRVFKRYYTGGKDSED